MALRIYGEGLDMVLHSNVEDNALKVRHIALDSNVSPLSKAIEEAVYESPVLLSDFDKVDCVVDTPKFTLLPSSVASPEVIDKLGRDLYPMEYPDLEAVVNPLDSLGCTLVCWLPRDLVGFLRRTFNNPAIHHQLSPFCRYFASKSRLGNSGKMYLNLRSGHIDVIAYGRTGLLVANTFRVRDDMDVLYYVMALREKVGFDGQADQLMVCGDPARRDALLPLLREYIPYVMPVIFPSTALRSGEDALKAPFNLIILPLCE